MRDVLHEVFCWRVYVAFVLSQMLNYYGLFTYIWEVLEAKVNTPYIEHHGYVYVFVFRWVLGVLSYYLEFESIYKRLAISWMMIPNLYIRNGWTLPFPSIWNCLLLGFQVYICFFFHWVGRGEQKWSNKTN